MTVAALIMLLIYVLVVCLLAYVVVLLLGRAEINSTVSMIVYAIAALIVLVLLLNTIGVLNISASGGPIW